jgi:hypothetical protein
VHENAHSSRAQRQKEVINRGFNVTRRRGRPRFEATNAVPDAFRELAKKASRDAEAV